MWRKWAKRIRVVRMEFEGWWWELLGEVLEEALKYVVS